MKQLCGEKIIWWHKNRTEKFKPYEKCCQCCHALELFLRRAVAVQVRTAQQADCHDSSKRKHVNPRPNVLEIRFENLIASHAVDLKSVPASRPKIKHEGDIDQQRWQVLAFLYEERNNDWTDKERHEKQAVEENKADAAVFSQSLFDNFTVWRANRVSC